ncbi:PhzF family phenazine biosynthesis protein [Murinocardiopsis flavida]|uniref:PhzF family phenazine biosynthesis protein n=1 Tax=Murinocardiopsis flavida TaxID=645275 RepID=A0A2P8CUZ7_9ACTN|nr:PhzF family phenazine biosynthesis protein [Murinocardiopsis flavida]PSK88786.1 PhzF family phenazine biosynthesis protein [Murinocardiopsis flavida]
MRIHIVDAFTDKPFAGNPAGVCVLPHGDWPQDDWMRRVAAELGFSETAFVLPMSAAPESDWAIRWFTPLVETNLCGHATLASAHVLRTEGRSQSAVRFHSRFSGGLAAESDDEGRVTLDFPAAFGTEVPVPAGLARVLGVEPVATYRTGALGDLLTVLPDEAAVRAAEPDLDAMAALTRREGLRGVIITAAAGADAGPGPGYDFVSRFFSPAEGIMEDPVTGSAHTALAPYWAARFGRDGLTGLQVSPRTGVVRTSVIGDRVHLTGHAVTVMDGTLHV